MKDKKKLMYIESVVVLMLMIIMVLAIIRNKALDMKIMILLSTSLIILNLILNKEKIFKYLLFVLAVFLIIPFTISYKSNQDDFFDSSTSVGKLQQEIYDQSGVSVFG